MNKDQLVAYKEFWESEMGKLAISKMEMLERAQIDFAMGAPLRFSEPDQQTTAALNRAAGIRSIITDIQGYIAQADAALKVKERRGADKS